MTCGQILGQLKGRGSLQGLGRPFSLPEASLLASLPQSVALGEMGNSLWAICLWAAGLPPEVFWLTQDLTASRTLAFLWGTGWIPGKIPKAPV